MRVCECERVSVCVFASLREREREIETVVVNRSKCEKVLEKTNQK